MAKRTDLTTYSRFTGVAGPTGRLTKNDKQLAQQVERRVKEEYVSQRMTDVVTSYTADLEMRMGANLGAIAQSHELTIARVSDPLWQAELTGALIGSFRQTARMYGAIKETYHEGALQRIGQPYSYDDRSTLDKLLGRG